MNHVVIRSVVMAWLFGLCLGGCKAQTPDKSSALWHIVNSCEHNQRYDHTPNPCELVKLDERYAILKDIRGNTQFLLIPTERISGIESPIILKEGTTNYWQAAWDARAYVSKRAGKKLPDTDIGMAINSPYGRSQNQLHIHIDCLKPKVVEAVAESKAQRNGEWFTVDLLTHHYQAFYVDSLDIDPFKVLAEHMHDMSRETLVVVGGGDGFLLLADSANLAQGNHASGEELLDHRCTLASAD